MHFSHVFKSSSSCAASPDGKWIATVAGTTPISLTVRSSQTLRSAGPVRLPTDFSAPVTTLAWSPSSSRLLVLAAQDVCVYELSARGPVLFATIKNPIAGPGKPSHVQFGHGDEEIIVFSTLGLKVLVFNLSTAKAAEIASPKWYHAVSAHRAYSVRPTTGHLALLTRVGGRDMLSIHEPTSRQLQRSWHPETNDAQAVAWSPDSQWLLLWDAAIHGRRLLLYTPDGQLFRSIDGPGNGADDWTALAHGIRLCRFSPNGDLCVVCDHSPSVAVLGTASWRREMTLHHPSTVSPGNTVQVWQEQSQGPYPTFVRATQPVTPPAPEGGDKPPRHAVGGCSSAQFDAASSLVATKLDDAPTTLWIWDLAASELRAVLIFHSNIEFHWHPSIRELLLISHTDETQRGPLFVWDPVSSGPRPVSLQDQIPNSKLASRTRGAWLNTVGDTPTLLITDNSHYCLASLSDDDSSGPYWQESTEYSINTAGDDTSVLDDTFSFKRG